MTLATCLVCGTRTDPGVACPGCGTPVPAESDRAAEASGQRKYWDSIQEKLTRAAAPKYHVTGLVGYGGMAGVFAADEPRLGRRVAMKVLSPALMIDVRLVERFMQEARTIAQLSHPNIVAIHDVDESDGLHWFTMTYLQGRTLGQVMGETVAPIPVSVVRAWLHQIASALGFAHAHGIVHRDIKPRNVLLDLLGNAMVTDFGIAKLADVDHGLTRTGLLIGTPAYMSPEQCSGDPVTTASDQYSLGAVLYQLLTGMTPFTGPTLAVLQAHVREPPRPIRDLRPDCPDALAGSIHRMLEKRPQDRWPALAAALTAAGAVPPGFDDPVRVRIEELAASAATLTIAPRPAQLSEGTRERVRVTVEDRAGRVLTARRIEWRSSQPAVAIVVADELLALSPGGTAFTASCGAASLSFEVAVKADPVGAVEVKPAAAVLHSGGQVRLDAAVADPHGSRLEGRVLLWSTSDPAVARVSAAGLVTAVAPGDATITARSGGKYAASSLTVTPAAAVSHATPADPVRAWTPETLGAEGSASPRQGSPAWEERATGAGRHPAVGAGGAATRGTPEAEGSAAPEQGPPAWEERATGAGRHPAVGAAGAATRGAPEAEGFTSPEQGPPAWEERATGAARHYAVVIAGAATRARHGATAALASTGRRAALLAGAATRASRGAVKALASTGRRVVVLASEAMRSSRRALPALTRTRPRRRSVAIAGAAAAAILAVTVVIVSLRIPTQEAGGQTETAPPVEPAPIAPAAPRDAQPATGNLQPATPAVQRAPVDSGPPAAPAPVVNARVSVAGDLPDGATVVVSDGMGRTWPLSARPIALPPGRYTVDFHAPGYESEREAIVLTSGRTELWTPNLQPVLAAEPAAPPPTRVSEEDQAAILDSLRPFVTAFSRRDTNVVLPAFPPSEHQRWRRVLESDDVTDVSAALLPTTSVRGQGNLASVSFSVTVSYRDQDEPQGAYVTFFGYAERRDDGWRLYEIEYVSIQDFQLD